ncbi:MAG: hypothetical protein K9N55_16200 [Phycisphaerae bacterium]|nr:hypothetical protein [Phycisphaerae bacterium]
MVVWLNIAWWGYLAVWGALLIHCLLKRQFFPLAGPHWATKGFWIITFVFLNPLLTLMYLIFGVFFRAEGKHAQHPMAVRVAGWVLVLGIVSVFELPYPDRPGGHITVTKHKTSPDNQGKLHFEAQAGVLEANNGMSTSTVSSAGNHARFCAKRISIRCESSHPLMDRVCRVMQQKIATLPCIESVDYWPLGSQQTTQTSHADVFIVLGTESLKESTFGIHRKVEADISCFVGSQPVPKFSNINYGNSPPTITFTMDNRLQHSGVFKGLESQSSRYKQQSENIAQQFVNTITKQFDTWIEKHGLMPDLPEYLYGNDTQPVEIDYLQQRHATCLHQSHGLFKNVGMIWSYEDERSNREAFTDIRNALTQEGWKGGSALDKDSSHQLESFFMSKDNKHLQIFRKRGRTEHGGILQGDNESLATKLPIMVEYNVLFSNKQHEEALRQLFISETDLETKLLFASLSQDDDIKQLLLESVRSQHVKTMRGYLLIGRYHANQEELAQATDALMLARAMSRTLREHEPCKSEFKSLAKQIGDDSLVTQEIGIDSYQRAGFIDINTVNHGTVFERTVNEPLMFYQCPADLEQDTEIKVKTIVIRISPPSGNESHQVETITKETGQSSLRKGGLSGSIFIPMAFLENTSFQLKAKELDGDRFKLTVVK